MDYTTKGIKIIKEKNLFDENYYIKNYGEEIGNQDPLNHFIFTGFKEGKNPSSNFDTVYYIQKYPDTKDFNPLIHYALWGKEEFRFTNLNMEMDYISLGINEIINQNLFDEDFYIKNYGKLIGNMDALTHYISYGFKEGKNPYPEFSNDFYLKKYPDTRKQNPLIHYALYGRKNGNFINESQLNPKNDMGKAIKIIIENNLFDSEFYLNRYEDVRKNRICPITHFIRFGFNENRKMAPSYDFDEYILNNNLSNDVNPLVHFILNNDFKDLKIRKSLEDIISADVKKDLESKHLVSVIMPTFNRRNVIKRAIDSVINQTFQSFELIIVDDGSTDGTETYIKNIYSEYLGTKIKYIKTSNNGVCKARNTGLKNSKGDIIAYLDSDNEWYNKYLEKMVYILDNFNVNSAYSSIKINNNIKLLSKINEKRYDRKKLLKENYIDLNIFIHKKTLYDKFGGFDEDLSRLVDWDLILRYTRDDEPYFVNEILAEYYIDASLNNISSTVSLDKNYRKIIKKNRDEIYSLGLDEFKIAYVLWDFPAFSQTFVINELRWLVEKGYKVKVFYKIDPDKKATLNFDLDYYKINDLIDLESKLRDFNPDIIHSHFVYPAGTLLTFPIAEKLKIPFTIFAHAIDIFLNDNANRNRVDELSKSKFCLKIITLGDYHYDFLINKGVPNEKLLLSRQATDYSIEKTIDMGDSRFKRNIKNIISIGRFVEKKGLDTFIEAASILKDEDFIFKIYGYGPLETELKDKVKKLNLTNVIFGGVLTGDEVKKAYLEGDLFVSPNKIAKNGDRDGMPTVLFEAMAYGIPIISTYLVTIPEFIQNNYSGFLIEPDNPIELANKIKEVSRLDKNQLFSIVKNAQNSVTNITSVEKTMNTYLRIWEEKRIGIFLVTYNSDGDFSTIDNILDRIYRYTTSPFDLLIVDNNSNEKFKDFLKNYSNKRSNMDVILLEDNIFCGPASNIAMDRLDNDFIFYLCSNEGFILKPGWELDALKIMYEDSNIAIAGNLVSSPSFFNAESYKNNEWFSKARNKDFIRNDSKKPLKHVQGGCFIIRKEAYNKSGGFNINLPQGHMDVEYSYYLESEGWKLGQIPNWISVTTKTLPNVYSYIDEETSLAHPLLLDDLSHIEDIIYNQCNICGGSIKSNQCLNCGSDKFLRSIYRIVGKTDKIYRNLDSTFILNNSQLPNVFNKMFKVNLFKLESFINNINLENVNVIISDVIIDNFDDISILEKFLSILRGESLLIFRLSENEEINDKIELILKNHNFILSFYQFNNNKLDNSKFLVALLN